VSSKQRKIADFSQGFYRRLLRMDAWFYVTETCCFELEWNNLDDANPTRIKE
jgi:hypothetical protein